MGEQRDWGGRNCKRNSMQICFGNEQNSLKLHEISHRWWIQVSSILSGFSGSCSILTPNEQTSEGNGPQIVFFARGFLQSRTITKLPQASP